jgi:transcriptional regulator with XRE-family HTH domain
MSEHPLEQWLNDRKRAGQRVRKRELAGAVGCSPSRITQILKYGSSPSLALAAKLSEETGIPIKEFVKLDEAAE